MFIQYALNDITPFDLKREIFRKSIHISGVLSIPLSFFLHPSVPLVLITLLSVFYLIAERFRLNGKEMPYVTRITNLATRADTESQHEVILSPIYLAIGIASSLLLFSEPISYVAIIALTLGDGVSSIIGKKYGKYKIPKTTKTFEGTASGILCVFLGSLFFVSPQLALFAAIVSMTLEALPIPINDNIRVPIGTGIVLWIVSLLY